ncbi:hypothetical protein [uncultured Dokdonia sp.]|mgnify:CR=1 FL=1|uniref:hypothetical protein n=1 Tax=uncultured Dokdonia sp. TaxID=575653 RepID=UPI00260CB7C0|nr:hypothetical protein [uncultured Dokdonia sp.]
MLQRRIAFLFLAISCFSCSQDETQETNNACALVDCISVSLRLEFVAADSGEDLFSNDTFVIDSLQIINTQTNQAINFNAETLGSGDRTVVVLPTFMESSTLESYQISIPNVFEVAFSFSVEAISDPCCLGNVYSNVAVNSDSVTIENTNFGTYRLLF